MQAAASRKKGVANVLSSGLDTAAARPNGSVWVASRTLYDLRRIDRDGREKEHIRSGPREAEFESLSGAAREARAKLIQERLGRPASDEQLSRARTPVRGLATDISGRLHILVAEGGSLAIDRLGAGEPSVERVVLDTPEADLESLIATSEGLLLANGTGPARFYLVAWDELERARWKRREGVDFTP